PVSGLKSAPGGACLLSLADEGVRRREALVRNAAPEACRYRRHARDTLRGVSRPERWTLASRRSTAALCNLGRVFVTGIRWCRPASASSSRPGRIARRAVPEAARVRGYKPRPQVAAPVSADWSVL